jgi:hypothetical protein
LKKQLAVITVFAVAITWAACSQGEKQVNLRFSFPQGKTLKYKQVSKRNYSVVKNDSIVDDKSLVDTLRIDLELVRLVDDTTYEVMEYGTLYIDCRSKEDTTKMERVELKTETLLRVLPNGKIESFEMIENEFNRTDEYVKNYYEQGTPVFPAGEKPVGYSWTQTTKVVLPEENLEASTTYNIKALVRHQGYDCALIEYLGNMAIPIVSNPKDTVQRSGVDRVNIKGLMYFAHKEGLVVEQTENWKIDGDRKQIAGDSICEYDVTQDYSVSYQLVSIEAAP